MDLAQQSPEYLAELARHHVGGHLKVAPEHTDSNVLRLMKKPDIERLRGLRRRRFKQASTPRRQEAIRRAVLHRVAPGQRPERDDRPGLFLKRNGYRPDQVQDFIPAPFDIATCMYYTGIDPFTGREVYVAKGLRDRKMQRA